MNDRSRPGCCHVAVLEPYYGGSHASFVDSLAKHSRHALSVATLPARKWKWRMRGAAIWFAQQDGTWRQGGDAHGIDAILCNDMLSVADLRALLPAELRDVPLVCYLHENQLTYPLPCEADRDFQYGMTNITSCLAADAVWFNSQYHMEAFLSAAGSLLRKMPDHVPAGMVETIRRKSRVLYPPVEQPDWPDAARPPHPTNAVTRILWSHRWEYDKNPKPFFDALADLHGRGAAFELVLLGEQFRAAPPVFADSWRKLQNHVFHAGFVTNRSDYWRLLAGCDLIVSCAIQENFGLSVVEAVLAGCQPLLVNRLSYPELIPPELADSCLFPDDNALLDRLTRWLDGHGRLTDAEAEGLRRSFRERFSAWMTVPRIDDALLDVARRPPGRA